MRETFMSTRALPADMRMSEALLLYRVGNLDAAELAVRAVIEKDSGQVNARAANMLSLIYASRGRTTEELDYPRAKEAAARIATARMDELCGGDHTCVIAGPDSPV